MAIVRASRISGLFVARLDKMKDPAVKEVITRDFDDAEKFGILATSWVYINGRHLTERSLPDLIDAIHKELKK